MKGKIGNTIKLAVFTALLGAFAGLVIWCFLKGVSIGTSLIWHKLPEITGLPYLTVGLCALGGLAAGLLHKHYGLYPEELSVVMQKIKKEKHYSYHPMFIMLVCAFLPLITGASVGPEAGLTGIIAGLCYWIGDNVTYAKNNADVFSQVGEAVSLGQLFHSPLFGIIAVEEEESDGQGVIPGLSKGHKLLLYATSTAFSFIVVEILNRLLGNAMEGFPAFADVSLSIQDYLLLLLYIPIGLVIYLIFELFEKITEKAAEKVPMIVRETMCGAAMGIIGLMIPLAVFSGEEQMEELMGTFSSYSPLILLGICLLKLLLTAFCLKFGMKGGHFFPLIFACTCMGFSISLMIFGNSLTHAAFAAGAITAAVLGAQLKKPLTAAVLLLLCFPLKLIPWIFLSAVLGMQGAKLPVFKHISGNEEAGH